MNDVGKKLEGMRKAGIAVTGMTLISFKPMEFKIACLVTVIAIVGIVATWSLSMYKVKKNAITEKVAVFND